MDRKTVLLHEMPRTHFEEYLRETPVPVAIIPVGSIEQHGPHLPLGMDILAATEIAKKVAEKANCIVAQVFLPGYSPHHMNFKGTITFHEETLVHILYDTIECLTHHGIRKILLINGHGGNVQILAYAARMASRKFNCSVLQPPAMPVADPVKAMRDSVARVDVHSGKGETGSALAMFPHLVDMSKVKGFKPTSAWRDEAIAKLADPNREDVLLAGALAMAYLGDTHDFTTSGIYGWTTPEDADPEAAKKNIEARVEWMAKFIELWRTIPEKEKSSAQLGKTPW